MVWYKDIADRLAVALALAVVADATLGASSVVVVALKGVHSLYRSVSQISCMPQMAVPSPLGQG